MEQVNGGITNNETIAADGRQDVAAGTATSTLVSGSETISNKGTASYTSVTAGGSQDVTAGAR